MIGHLRHQIYVRKLLLREVELASYTMRKVNKAMTNAFFSLVVWTFHTIAIDSMHNNKSVTMLDMLVYM